MATYLPLGLPFTSLISQLAYSKQRLCCLFCNDTRDDPVVFEVVTLT